MNALRWLRRQMPIWPCRRRKSLRARVAHLEAIAAGLLNTQEYAAAPQDEQPVAYTDPAVLRIQERRRRIAASGLTALQGGAR